MVELNVLYDQLKNLRSANGVKQKNVTISDMAKARGEKLIEIYKKLMPFGRKDWDFSFLVEFLIALADSNIETFKIMLKANVKSVLDTVIKNDMFDDFGNFKDVEAKD